MIGMAERNPAVVVSAADVGIFAHERGMVFCAEVAGRVWTPVLVVSACLADSAKGYFVPLTIIVRGRKGKDELPVFGRGRGPVRRALASEDSGNMIHGL